MCNRERGGLGNSLLKYPGLRRVRRRALRGSAAEGGGLPVPQLTQWVVQKSRLRRSVEGRVMSLFSTAGAMDDGKIAPAALGE